MKRISFLFLVTFLTSMLISSCSDLVTYAEQLKTEKAAIATYIKDNKINVISTLPKPGSWGDKDYYLTPEGIYFHLVDSGIGADTLALNDEVIPRFREYTLDATPILTKSNWSTMDYPRPDSFVFGTSQSCVGFQNAAKYMRHNESQAKVIIPSKIGFYYLTSKEVIPYVYDLKIQIQK